MYTGIDVGRALRTKQNKGQILYFTSSNEYAVDAFSLKASHYLLKPYTINQFAEALNRAFHAISSVGFKQICLKTEDGALYNLDIKDIRYAESHNHRIMVHTDERIIATRRILSTLLEELNALAPNVFICPYKGYLVNQKAILSISKDSITVKGGGKIPIPKRSYKALQDGYMRFLFDHKEGGLS